MSIEIQILVLYFEAGLERARRDDRGYSTEFVVTTALVVAAAIAIVAVIVAKAIQKANSIEL
ncbi:hypothetical protein AB0E59_06070 [Lentzea sp. NPDC034063]|uniref:hypothetical protein n=1 Tax=unclassified Lentzea TaxID=2643253 RepID=UPI0033C8CF11